MLRKLSAEGRERTKKAGDVVREEMIPGGAQGWAETEKTHRDWWGESMVFVFFGKQEDRRKGDLK